MLVLCRSVVHTHLCFHAHIICAIQNFGGYKGVHLWVHKHRSFLFAHWKSRKPILPRHPPKLNSTHTYLTCSAETMHAHKSSPILCRSTTDHAKRLGRRDSSAPRADTGRASLAAARTKGRPSCKPPETLPTQAILTLFPACQAFPRSPSKYKHAHMHAVIKSIQTCKHAFHKITRSLAQTLICLQNDIN